MGGYNTVCELLAAVPSARCWCRASSPGWSSCIRAERMAAMGLLAMLHPAQLCPSSLMRALQRELQALE
jgi:predicted glycosyltransferase